MGCKYPEFIVSVERIIFQNIEGRWWDPPSQRFTIDRVMGSGGRPLNWAITSSEDWLIPRPARGEGSKSIKVICHTRKLSPGQRFAELSIAAPGNQSKTISVTINIYPK